MNENILSKLHDIKELENIPDNSIFIFSFLIFIGISILLIILFFVIKFFRNKKQSDRKKYYKILQEIDFKDSKSSAYKITKYSRLLAISEREKKLCEELIFELDKFKYKKEVSNIDDSIKAKYSRFMDSLDV